MKKESINFSEDTLEEAKSINEAFDIKIKDWVGTNNELIEDIISRANWWKQFYESNEVEPFDMDSFF